MTGRVVCSHRGRQPVPVLLSGLRQIRAQTDAFKNPPPLSKLSRNRCSAFLGCFSRLPVTTMSPRSKTKKRKKQKEREGRWEEETEASQFVRWPHCVKAGLRGEDEGRQTWERWYLERGMRRDERKRWKWSCVSEVEDQNTDTLLSYFIHQGRRVEITFLKICQS